MKILGSASKIVFILMAMGVVAFTAVSIIEAKDFMVLSSMVFGYYFANKSSNPIQDPV